ncbi:MAG: rhodanese-like domain-containing protein [Burkholderiaceae bacterium]|nr:rhodanese-like domain-containing protein [Burkholderiaceae bacterium]
MQFFIDNIFLVLAAFVSGGLLVWPLVMKNSVAKEINTLAATQLLNGRDALLIDLRETTERGRGLIPQARSIPNSTLTDQIESIKKDVQSGKGDPRPVILVCASGRRSPSAGRSLRKAGVGEVYSLEGGFDAWQQAGLPVSSKGLAA